MLDQVSLAWLVAAVLLTVVLLYGWKQTGSFFKAWLVMLVFGKVIAAIYYFIGLDKTVFILRLVNRQDPSIVRTLNFTAAELLFLSFFLTLVSSIVLVLYTNVLPREFRTLKRFYGVENNE